tara:strand:- start:2259 stop:2804 length:546 start_codon:yes stop_codon:yes gene_type:complete
MNKNNFLKIKLDILSNNFVPNSFISKDKQTFYFKWIMRCDSKKLLEIRNSRYVRIMMNDTKPISIKEHNNFLLNYSDLPRIDFIICDKKYNQLIGSVNLNLTELGLEIGKYIGDKNFLGIGIAKQAMIQFLEYLQLYFPQCSFFSKTKKENIVNIALNEKLGFKFYKKIGKEYILMKMGKK